MSPKKVFFTLFLSSAVISPFSGVVIYSSAKAASAFPRMAPVAPAGTYEQVFKDLPGSGKTCWIDEEYYFTYRFSEKPKLGTVILKIEIFKTKDERDHSYAITGQYDMPSMGGAHDSGLQEFKLNKKFDYLLPLNIVMPGEWEVKLTFRKNNAAVFFGRFLINV